MGYWKQWKCPYSKLKKTIANELFDDEHEMSSTHPTHLYVIKNLT